MLRKDATNKTDRWSQHGLGHLLNPTEIGGTDRDWVGQVWLNMLRKLFRLSTQALKFKDLPAAGRVSVSSPAAMRSFSSFNAGKIFCEQIKPFNFVLTCQVKQLGHPSGVEPERFHLIAPYDANAIRWVNTDWIDQYSGGLYGITTQGHHGTRTVARVKTYGEILREYEFHPESKCADAEGTVCERQTVGILQRRHIQIDGVRFIGKESNSLEDVDAGILHSADAVYTEYCDPTRDAWNTKILPVLRKLPLSSLTEKTGLSRRALTELRSGRCRPQPKNRNLIVEFLHTLGLL
jgi:hypothetical protein